MQLRNCSPSVAAELSFRRLYDGNHARILRLLTRLVGPGEAEDLAQRVFARAAEALPCFRGEASASTWLYRIATNLALDWRRSRAAKEAQATFDLSALPEGEPLIAESSMQASPERALARAEMGRCIRSVMAGLPDTPRTTLALAERGGRTEAEIADFLGISAGAARVRLDRARARLKAALETACDLARDEENGLVCEPKPGGSCAKPASRRGGL